LRLSSYSTNLFNCLTKGAHFGEQPCLSAATKPAQARPGRRSKAHATTWSGRMWSADI
jgi:hypothetical protein